MESAKTRAKVIIIGAGASGLFAAYNLSKQNLTTDIIILEAESRIGGRVHTIPFNDHVIELGAQWIHGRGDNPLWKFVTENNIALADRANRDSEGLFLRCDGEPVPKSVSEETIDFLWSIHEEANKFSRDPDCVESVPKSMGHYFKDRFAAWLESDKKSDDETTRSWRKQLFQWFIKFEECDTGCDNFYEHSCISWGEYLDYGDDASFARGYVSVLDAMVSQMPDVPIIFEQTVTKIQYNHVGVQVSTSSGQDYFAEHVISTLPLGVLKKLHTSLFDPGLPTSLVSAIESISFGSIDRIKLDFLEAFWDLEDPGLLIVQKEELQNKVTRQNWFRHIFTFDEVLYHPTTLMGWISGDAARFMEELSDDEIASDICHYLESIMQKFKRDPSWKLPKLRQIVVTRWSSNPHFCGVYSYRNQNSDAQGITNEDLSRPESIKECPRVLFAGEATDAKHYGTVHGALSAAQREVARLELFWKNNQ